MEKIKQLWSLLSGKKTNVGAILLILAQFLQQLVEVLPEQQWLVGVAEGCLYVGNLLVGTGLTHKFVKAVGAK